MISILTLRLQFNYVYLDARTSTC